MKDRWHRSNRKLKTATTATELCQSNAARMRFELIHGACNNCTQGSLRVAIAEWFDNTACNMVEPLLGCDTKNRCFII